MAPLEARSVHWYRLSATKPHVPPPPPHQENRCRNPLQYLLRKRDFRKNWCNDRLTVFKEANILYPQFHTSLQASVKFGTADHRLIGHRIRTGGGLL
jgi:hypothetical protein